MKDKEAREQINLLEKEVFALRDEIRNIESQIYLRRISSPTYTYPYSVTYKCYGSLKTIVEQILEHLNLKPSYHSARPAHYTLEEIQKEEK